MNYSLREFRRQMSDGYGNPFKPGMPLFRLFEESKAFPVNTPDGYVPGTPSSTTDEPDNPFSYADMQAELAKVTAHNAELTKELNTANAVLRETIDANGKLYDEALKSTSKVDALYKATNTLAELCTMLIRALK
jgi:hypothetical protein